MFGSCMQISTGAASTSPEYPPSPTSTTLSSGGALTITSKWMKIAGYGAANDSVESIVVGSDFIGAEIRCDRDTNDITFLAAVIQRAANVTLNHDDDSIKLFVTAANTVKMANPAFTAGG